MNKIKFFTYIFALLLMFGFIPTISNAAMFELGKDAKLELSDASKDYANLYAIGQDVVIKTNVKKDLNAIASTVEIDSSNIERSANIAANVITIKNAKIGGSVKLAASVVKLENVEIQEDLLIAAGRVTFVKTNVLQDLAVASGEGYTMEDSIISGSLFSGNEVSDSIKNSVKGQIYQSKREVSNDPKISNFNTDYTGGIIAVASYISGFVVLLIGSLILAKYRKLHSIEISEQKNIFKHITRGGLLLLALPLLFIITLLSVFLLSPLTFALILLLIGYMSIISPFTSYYLGNLIFKDKVQIWQIVAIYVALLILKFIPIINTIVAILEFVIFMATLGYFATISYRLKKSWLANQDLLGDRIA